MKVFPLHIGDTKVPYGQFYGGVGEEWAGWRGIWRFLTDKSHYIVVPIYVFLIEHPTQGLILVDAGINRDQAHAHDRYYDRWLLRVTLDEDEYRLSPGEELSVQLDRLGCRPADIGKAVLTHLHEDHLGELRLLDHAEVVLSHAAWDSKNLGVFSFRKWSPSFRGAGERARRVGFDSGSYPGFPSSHDLLGDGTIRLLPTPGHAGGHLSVLVETGDYPFLITGDALYTLRHLAVDQVKAISLGRTMRKEQTSSIRRIQELRARLPDTVILPSHDHTGYQYELIDPFLADGRLSPEERDQIAAYEEQLFGEGWRLAPNAEPEFVAAGAGPVGAVAGP